MNTRYVLDLLDGIPLAADYNFTVKGNLLINDVADQVARCPNKAERERLEEIVSGISNAFNGTGDEELDVCLNRMRRRIYEGLEEKSGV